MVLNLWKLQQKHLLMLRKLSTLWPGISRQKLKRNWLVHLNEYLFRIPIYFKIIY